MNFYLENSSCEYYTKDSFNNILAENQSRLNLKCSTLETGPSLLHINIHSLANKFDKLSSEISYYWDFWDLAWWLLSFFRYSGLQFFA